MTLPHLSHPKYRRDIDGLRAIAVLSVVAFHAFPNWMKGGFIGVDIFFVISGYLISTIIFENLDKGIFSFTEFYVRRVKRIFPALIIVLASCYAFGWFTLLSDEYKQLGKHIIGGAGFVSNFVLWNESGYFDNSADIKPLLHLWSLGIEEQFYIVWPLLLWAAYKKRFNLFSIGVSIALISFYFNIKQINSDAVADFYSPLTRFWELMLGSILAWVTLYKPSFSATHPGKLDRWLGKAIFRDQTKNDGTTLASTISVLGLLLLAYGFWRINKDTAFPGKWALIPVLSAALLIFSGPKALVNRTVLSNRIAVWIGLISFPLYLWHWPLLSFSRIILGETPNRGIRLAAVALSIILAFITYFFVERPVRFGKHGKIKVVFLVLIMASIGFVGYNTYHRDGLKFRPVSANFRQTDYSYDISHYGFKSCGQDLTSGDYGLNYCYGNSSVPTALIIGDSHADDKFFGIQKFITTYKWQVVGNSSCPPLMGVNISVADHTACNERVSKIFNYIDKSKNIDLVVLSFAHAYPLDKLIAADHIAAKFKAQDNNIIDNNNKNLNKVDAFYGGLDRSISFLEQHGKKVVLVIDIPELPFFPKDCIRLGNACHLNLNDVLQRQSLMRTEFKKLKEKHPNIRIFDPIKLFCKDNICISKFEERSLYRDSHHLSLFGSEMYGKSFSDWFYKP